MFCVTVNSTHGSCVSQTLGERVTTQRCEAVSSRNDCSIVWCSFFCTGCTLCIVIQLLPLWGVVVRVFSKPLWASCLCFCVDICTSNRLGCTLVLSGIWCVWLWLATGHHHCIMVAQLAQLFCSALLSRLSNPAAPSVCHIPLF